MYGDSFIVCTVLSNYHDAFYVLKETDAEVRITFQKKVLKAENVICKTETCKRAEVLSGL